MHQLWLHVAILKKIFKKLLLVSLVLSCYSAPANNPLLMWLFWVLVGHGLADPHQPWWWCHPGLWVCLAGLGSPRSSHGPTCLQMDRSHQGVHCDSFFLEGALRSKVIYERLGGFPTWVSLNLNKPESKTAKQTTVKNLCKGPSSVDQQCPEAMSRIWCREILLQRSTPTATYSATLVVTDNQNALQEVLSGKFFKL